MADNAQGTNQTPFYAVPKAPQIPAEFLFNTFITGSITLSVTDQICARLGINPCGTITIPFHLENDFGFSLGNKWESLVPDVASEFLSTTYNLLTMGNVIEGSQFRVVSRAMQTLAWKGSENPEFTVNATFVCTQRNYNPAGIIKVLSAACLPLSRDEASPEAQKDLDTASKTTAAGVKKVTGFMGNTIPGAKDSFDSAGNSISKAISSMGLIAPLEYTSKVHMESDSANIERGGVSLNIGYWFKATNLVIKSISNISFSKESIAPVNYWDRNTADSRAFGFPLYAKCQITLVPHMPITFADFCNYFTSEDGLSSVGGSTSRYGTSGEELGI